MAYNNAKALRVVRKFFPEVARVQDAQKALVVTVQPRDIQNTKRKNHNDCAVAQACKRQFRFDGAVISMTRAYLLRGDVATRYIVPEAVSREITSFDRGGEFRPGAYVLQRVSPTNRYGAKPRGTSGPHKTKRRPAAHYHLTENVRTSILA